MNTTNALPKLDPQDYVNHSIARRINKYADMKMPADFSDGLQVCIRFGPRWADEPTYSTSIHYSADMSEVLVIVAITPTETSILRFD